MTLAFAGCMSIRIGKGHCMFKSDAGSAWSTGVQGREHKQFITRLSHELRSAAASPEAARAQFVGRLAAAAYTLPALEVRECSMAEAASVLASKPMCNTKIIDLANHLASAGN
jgi:hypothetical protein